MNPNIAKILRAAETTRVFNPLVIPGCRLFFDSVDLSTQARTGNILNTWSNKGLSTGISLAGQGNITTTTRNINGVNAIGYPGSPSHLLMSPTGDFIPEITAGAHTMMMVVQADSPATNSRLLNATNSSNGFEWGIDLNGGNVRIVCGSTVHTIAAADTNPHIIGFKFTGTQIVPIYDDVLAALSANIPSLSVSGPRIGRANPGNSLYFVGATGDILFYNSDLNTANTNYLLNGLKEKFNIS